MILLTLWFWGYVVPVGVIVAGIGWLMLGAWVVAVVTG
jgi:hypothetical protein